MFFFLLLLFPLLRNSRLTFQLMDGYYRWVVGKGGTVTPQRIVPLFFFFPFLSSSFHRFWQEQFLAHFTASIKAIIKSHPKGTTKV